MDELMKEAFSLRDRSDLLVDCYSERNGSAEELFEAGHLVTSIRFTQDSNR